MCSCSSTSEEVFLATSVPGGSWLYGQQCQRGLWSLLWAGVHCTKTKNCLLRWQGSLFLQPPRSSTLAGAELQKEMKAMLTIWRFVQFHALLAWYKRETSCTLFWISSVWPVSEELVKNSKVKWIHNWRKIHSIIENWIPCAFSKKKLRKTLNWKTGETRDFCTMNRWILCWCLMEKELKALFPGEKKTQPLISRSISLPSCFSLLSSKSAKCYKPEYAIHQKVELLVCDRKEWSYRYHRFLHLLQTG